MRRDGGYREDVKPIASSCRALLRRALLLAFGLAAIAGCPAGQPTTPKQTVKPAATRVPTAAEPSPTPQRFLTFEVLVQAPAADAGAAPPWKPVSGAEVTVAFAATRRPLAEASPARTDAQGRANFSIKPPGQPLLLLAKVDGRTLSRVYPVVAGGRATVDPSTSLVAAYFAQLEVGLNDAMKRIDAPRLEALAVKVRGKLEADAAGVDLTSDATMVAAYEAMLAADPQLSAQTYAALGRSQLGAGKPTPAPGTSPQP